MRRVLATVALGLLAWGAGGARAETFTLWARSDDANFITAVVDEYNRTHDDKIRLSVIVAQQLVQKFAAANAAGAAPDAIVLDLVYVPAFAFAGVLEDISDWAEKIPFRAALSKAHTRQGMFEGRTYAVPYSAEGSILLYNKTLFRRAGLDPNQPPRDWASLVADAERVHALGPDMHGWFFSAQCGSCQVFEFTPFVWADGGDVLVDDGGKATIDTEPMAEAIGLYRTLVEKAGVPPQARIDNGGTGVSLFASGRLAMENLGAFSIGIFDAKYPKLDYGVAPIPGKNGGEASFAGGDDIAVCAPGRHEAAVERFIEWSWSLPGQKLLASHGSLPVRTDLAQQALAGLDPRLEVSEHGMEIGHTPYTTVFNDLFNNNNGPWAVTVGRAIFGDDPKAALAEGQREMQAIIDRNKVVQ